MARYDHLPIYKKAMETAVYLQQIVRNFSRYDKYTIGTDLRNMSREILLLIIRANSAENKTEILRTLVEQCEMLKTSVYFSKEVKALASLESFRKASELAVQLCRQSQGWLQSTLDDGEKPKQAEKKKKDKVAEEVSLF